MHIFFIILIFNLFYANEIVISGTVLDNKNNPIANVTIESKDESFTRTNREGYFMISVDNAGPQDITFKHIAYKNKTINLDSRTKDLKAECLEADIIVAAVGIPELVKGDWVKKGSIVIDVGINKIDKGIVGDVDFKEVSKNAKAITPVPGGVGPMTIACLLKNTIDCFKRSQI